MPESTLVAMPKSRLVAMPKSTLVAIAKSTPSQCYHATTHPHLQPLQFRLNHFITTLLSTAKSAAAKSAHYHTAFYGQIHTGTSGLSFHRDRYCKQSVTPTRKTVKHVDTHTHTHTHSSRDSKTRRHTQKETAISLYCFLIYKSGWISVRCICLSPLSLSLSLSPFVLPCVSLYFELITESSLSSGDALSLVWFLSLNSPFHLIPGRLSSFCSKAWGGERGTEREREKKGGSHF